jgi:hypothetical protein
VDLFVKNFGKIVSSSTFGRDVGSKSAPIVKKDGRDCKGAQDVGVEPEAANEPQAARSKKQEAGSKKQEARSSKQQAASSRSVSGKRGWTEISSPPLTGGVRGG